MNPARRSFIHWRLRELGAEWVEGDDYAVAHRLPRDSALPLALVDLSPLMRTGIKGPRTGAWLRERGWPVPDVNDSARTADGASLLRLGHREVLILADPLGDDRPLRQLEAEIPGAGAWQVPRRDSHCWFLLRGESTVECLAKLCSVDLRRRVFPPGSIAQTTVARLPAIVSRDLSPGSPSSFHLLADSAAALWFWDALLDAMAEFGGGPAGISALG